MPTRPQQRLAQALTALKRLQGRHHGVIESKELTTEQRKLLVKTGFLRPVIKGWHVTADPKAMPGDSTAWYASFWTFLSGYLGKRFGHQYCLNPDASLLLHTGHTVVQRQVVVIIPKGGAGTLALPFDTSMLLYPDRKRLPMERVEIRGLLAYPLHEALCLVPPSFFRNHPQEAQLALVLLRDVSELIAFLVDGDGLASAAGRLAGALRFMGRMEDADRILSTMEKAFLRVTEQNPFENEEPVIGRTRERSPYALRMEAMWNGWRKTVLEYFPGATGPKLSSSQYLAQVEERYRVDAYNSLSIEGYQVTNELIERVAKRGWNPEETPEDKKDLDALAARGYYEAFLVVKQSLSKILGGKNAGDVVRTDHHEWHAALFNPAVTAGIIKIKDLAGYRSGPVYIRNSKHTPLPREALLDAMEKLFALLTEESSAAVRAVLGHHLFVFIHPYYDGNGRLGRFLLNAMLASGGYPWAVVRMARRAQYLSALETASVGGDILPLTRFLAEEMVAGDPGSAAKAR